ncbi:Protein kinase, catalytic domain-containing protein, partial [Cynara cardunculus var. scolymus]
GSLRSYLSKNRNKKLPLKTVVRFALDIAKGLCYLHSKKIIHCDVKPENMLIDEQHTIKLADFGESRFESLEHFLIQSGEIGTRSYMAPEIIGSIDGAMLGHRPTKEARDERRGGRVRRNWEIRNDVGRSRGSLQVLRVFRAWKIGIEL